MSIPSDYSIRSVRPLGCFWGAGGDLDRLLKNPRQADFDTIQRGVFWCPRLFEHRIRSGDETLHERGWAATRNGRRRWRDRARRTSCSHRS
jgi:hypothetical protein